MDLADSASLVRRAEAVASGWTDAELRQRVASGDLHRVRRGGYITGADLSDLTPEAHHRLAVRLLAPTLGAGVISHASAAAMWDLPVVDADLSRVHVTLPPVDRSGRIRAERHDHVSALGPADLAAVEGIAVTSPARTVIDLARSEPASCAVVLTDAVLQRGLADAAAVRAATERCRGLPGLNRARRALRNVDGRSESPGESLTRLLIDAVGPFEAQVEIIDDAGHFVGRVDFGREDAAVLVEFDGRAKYVRHRSPGQSIQDAVLAEKHREDELRALGYSVVRMVWSDLGSPVPVLERLKRTIERGLAARARGVVPRGVFRPRPPLTL